MKAAFRGHIDTVEPCLSGWIVDGRAPDRPVTLRVAVDGRWLAVCRADRPRPDVSQAGLGGPDCGFSVPLPAGLLDGGVHEVTVALADGRALALPGRPRRVVLGPVRAEVAPVGAGDAAALAALLRTTLVESRLAPDRVTEGTARTFIQGTALTGGALVAARAHGALVGYGLLERTPDEAFRRLGLLRMTVLAAYRGKRLGERLLAAVIDAAAARGVETLYLSVAPGNAPARGLYRKAGFEPRDRCPVARWAPPGDLVMARPVAAR